MAIHDNLTREHILQSIAECDEIGRDAFLKRYGRSRAVSYFLVHNGKHYDSKAIVGVAHKFATGHPLKTFSGGKPVQRALEKLGFNVEVMEVIK